MVMFGLASLVAASRGRAGWAGILLGLAFATKVQGLYFAPLLPIFWVMRQPKRSSCPAQRVLLSSCHPFWRFSIGVGLIVLAVLLWDRSRGGLPFWVQQTVNYGGIRLIYASELGPRLTGWLDLLPYFFGPIVGCWLNRVAVAALSRSHPRGPYSRRLDRSVAAHLHGRPFGVPLAAGLSRLGSLPAYPCADRGLLLGRSFFWSSLLLVPRGCCAIFLSPNSLVSPFLPPSFLPSSLSPL